jgi:hypothetical protein
MAHLQQQPHHHHHHLVHHQHYTQPASGYPQSNAYTNLNHYAPAAVGSSTAPAGTAGYHHMSHGAMPQYGQQYPYASDQVSTDYWTAAAAHQAQTGGYYDDQVLFAGLLIDLKSSISRQHKKSDKRERERIFNCF